MKKLSIVMTMLLAVLLLASCSKNQSARLIPDNAFAVLSLNVIKTMESTGMKGDDTSVKEQIEKFIKDAGLDKEVRDKLMDIIDDPTSSGIDFTEPIYLYFALGGSNGLAGGLVGTTANKGDLEDVIKMMGDMDDDIELQEYESDGVQYARLDHSTILAFNSDWFYLGPVERGSDWEEAAEDTIEEILDRANGNNNMEGNEVFEQMSNRKGLLQVAFFGTGWEDMPGMSEAMSQLPEGCELKDIGGIADLIINNGEIVLEGETILLSDAWKEQLDIIKAETIEKSQAKYADAEGALAIINADPKGLYDYLKKLLKNAGASDSDMDMLNEAKPIFDTLTGQAMIALNSWERNDNPEVVAYVGTSDNTLVETIMSKGADSEEVVKVDDDEYRIPIDYDYDYNDSIGDYVMTPTKFINAGWKNDQTYFLMNTDDEPFTAPRHAFTDVKGMGLFIYVAGEMLGQAISNMNDDMDMVGKAVEDVFDYMELYMESSTKGVFRIAMNDKDKSPIVTIIDYVKKNFM